MAREEKKKLSGYQNLLNKRKREEDLEKTNFKISNFFRKTTEDTTSDNSDFLHSTKSNLPSELEKQSNEDEDPKELDPGTFQSVSVPMVPSCSSKSKQDELSEEAPISNDPGLWPSVLSPIQVQELVEKGSTYYQNKTMYPKDKSGRKFSDIYFTRILLNGEKVQRHWLLYSIEKNAVFCFCCKIFNDPNNPLTFKNTKLSNQYGFSDWHHLSEHLKIHEKSKSHFQNLRVWSDLLERLKTNKTVDSEMENLLKNETKHWRSVIERIIYTIQFLAEQNLAFRGPSNKLFERNNGNFLKCIEMIAKFDPVMSAHINRSDRSQKNISLYLGDKIQNETIKLLGDNIRNNILNEVKEAKYFSILLDCTPDVSRQEQISVCLRYVNLKNNKFSVEERFLTFRPISDTTGEGLTNFLLKTLENYGLDIYNMRGQGYDNGSNMKGRHQGVQKRILDINPRAMFVPCCNHSLNLVINDAVKSNISCINFFSTLQELYNFFSASTNRWSVLKSNISNLTLKPLSDTRWSSRIDAITPLRFQLGEIYDALYEILSGNKFDNTTKHLATSLGKKIKNYEFVCMVVLWYKILSKVNVVTKILQSKTFNISQACESLNNLNEFLKKYRSDKGFSDLLVDSKEIASCLEVDAKFISAETLRPRKIKKQFSYEGDDQPIENQEIKFKVNCFFGMLDTTLSSVHERFKLLSCHSDVFNFLWNVEDFGKYSDQDQFNFCKKLEETLTDKDRNEKDIDGTELLHELQFLQNGDKNATSVVETLNYIAINNLTHSFPNITIALRILLTIPVSVATAERSFSKLKLIKNYLRSRMGQERLENLAIISIESDFLKNLEMDNLVKEFAKNKARKVQFL